MTLTKEGPSVALKKALGGYLFFEADDLHSPLSSPDASQRPRWVLRWNHRFQFHKRSQPFIRTYNETLSVATVCINDLDRSPVGIHG
jgi:hypothetical protein